MVPERPLAFEPRDQPWPHDLIASILMVMAKATVQFICRSCGALQPKWMGKCPDCGTWDALEEHRPVRGATGPDPHRGAADFEPDAAPRALPLHEVGDEDQAGGMRMATGIFELDRVLGGCGGVEPEALNGESGGEKASSQPQELAGAASSGAHATLPSPHAATAGGLVPGSAVLLGGDPGIGKSTLMLQAAHSLVEQGRRVLYVTSEESARQLRLRAERLGALGDGEAGETGKTSAASGQLYVLADTNLARIIEQARQVSPDVLVIDSIQMIYKADQSAAPGSVTQLRGCCMELIYFAKSTTTALLLVGHVTKKGQVAGPRLLEHMVDTVLYFEGDRFHSHRIVRATKNRFGTTLEVGLFEMTDAGLCEVTEGAGVAASEYQTRSGSVVCPVLQGSRCLLVEMQALTATGFLGNVKRKVSGLDTNRLAMLIAVLEKRAGLRLADQDVFASSVGGMRVIEPAADLAIALAITGAHYDRQLDTGVCAVGEIGLGGELRHVQHVEQRIREATRLGFTRILCPPTDLKAPAGAQLIPVDRLDRALEHLA